MPTAPSSEEEGESLKGKLGFLTRKLERLEDSLAPKPAPSEMSAEQRIAELEQRTWKAEAIARHGLSAEDAMFLHGSEGDIDAQAALLAEKTKAGRGAVSPGASVPPLPLPATATRPRSRAEQAEQEMREFVRSNQQRQGTTF